MGNGPWQKQELPKMVKELDLEEIAWRESIDFEPPESEVCNCLACASGWGKVNIQVPGLGVAASNRGLRSSVGRGVAVVGERGFGDDCGL